MKPESKHIDESTQSFPLELFISALNAAADAIVISDTKARILWVNSAFEEMSGYSYSEIIGKATSIFKSKRQSNGFYENLWNTINSAKVWRGEIWNRKKNGEEYLEEQSITPVTDDNLNITHFIAIKRDISDKVAIRRQLEHAEKMDAIGHITGGISHNFNNKLATILGYTELAIGIVSRLSDEKLIRYLNKIYIAGGEAKHLVAQLRSFCKEKSKRYLPLNLVTVTRDMIEFVEAFIPSSIELEITTDNAPSMIQCDPVQIQQMIMILVRNSIKAMNESGKLSISINSENVNRQICIGCQKSIEGKFVQLVVCDTGCGISQTDMRKIFLPFFTTHLMDGGTGMGLSVLHGILHEHNGHVLVESDSNSGTTFKLLFPSYEKYNNYSENIEQVKTDNKEAVTDALHILLVEKERTNVGNLESHLTSKGYQVSVKNNTQDALSGVIKEPSEFDLVIVEQDMPGFSGLNLIRAIKNVRPEIATILTHDNHIGELERDGKIKGLVDGRLSKPVNEQLLGELISKLLMKI